MTDRKEREMETIGIIEDDRLLNQGLKIALEKEGFATISAYDCKSGIRLREQEPDLLLVDVNLPDGDGISLCRTVRQYGDIPVIFLTGRDEEEDMLGAFSAGADDYVVKPFPMKVLMKRIEAVLRRSREEKPFFLYKGLQIDFGSRQVSYGEKEVLLTAREYRLLEFLAKHKGQVLSKEQILEAVWDLDGLFVGENTVSVTINRLRRKIEPDVSSPVFIRNLFGQGYVFGE